MGCEHPFEQPQSGDQPDHQLAQRCAARWPAGNALRWSHVRGHGLIRCANGCAQPAVQQHWKFRIQQFRKMRSEEHTSELQSLMRISYAVFCLKKKKIHTIYKYTHKYTHMNKSTYHP